MFLIFACVVFWSLTIVSHGRIEIHIQVPSDQGKGNVTFKGYDYKLITDKEMSLFNVSIENLNRAMRVELGKVPDGVYFKDPTPQGSLYSKYKWDLVKRRMEVSKAEVIDIVKEEMLLGTEDFINNTSMSIEKNHKLFFTEETAVSSTWNNRGLPEEDKKMFYDVWVENLGQVLKFKNLIWRKNNLKGLKSPFGRSTKAASVDVKPGQTVTTVLKGKKTIMLIKVQYKASLVGSFIADFENVYGKYHYYAPSVKNIMKAGKIKNAIFTTELLEIRCFTDPVLKVIDKRTGENMEIIVGDKLFHRPSNVNRKPMTKVGIKQKHKNVKKPK